MKDHVHSFVGVDSAWHENEYRIRTVEECFDDECDAIRYGCFAKRLDADGLEAWGPVGVWTYSEPAAAGSSR